MTIHKDLYSVTVRTKLNKEFSKRCKVNSQYSLRSFARSLCVDPTLLSRLMKGQRKVTTEMGERLFNELNFKLDQIQRISSKNLKESKSNEKKLIKDDLFLISDWYYFAILDLFSTEGFRQDKRWMAKRLDLSTSEFNSAFQQLIDKGHIVLDGEEFRVKTQSTSWVNNRRTSLEKKRYQKKILKQATQSIEKFDFSKRESSTLTLPANSYLIPEIKIQIQNFKNELRRLIESEGNYDEVYQVSINIFPLTKKIEDKK